MLVKGDVDVIFTYDGSIEGFYCCVYDSIYSKQKPFDIIREDLAEPSLFFFKYIETELEKSEKVRNSIIKKISVRALQLVETVFLSCMEKREIAIFNFLMSGYKIGNEITQMISHENVYPLLKAEQNLSREAENFLGFVRFSDFEGILTSVISPKNFVLPFISRHFANRYRNEKFIIFDDVHKAALFYENRKTKIIPVESIDFPEISEQEDKYQRLWKHFYKVVAIESRFNPKCRMTHMPKRYWSNITEMKELL